MYISFATLKYILVVSKNQRMSKRKLFEPLCKLRRGSTRVKYHSGILVTAPEMGMMRLPSAPKIITIMIGLWDLRQITIPECVLTSNPAKTLLNFDNC